MDAICPNCHLSFPVKAVKKAPLTADEGFLLALKANPAYEGIDIDKELGKMDAWLMTPKGRGRQKNRRFIVNWLNKLDPSQPRVAVNGVNVYHQCALMGCDNGKHPTYGEYCSMGHYRQAKQRA